MNDIADTSVRIQTSSNDELWLKTFPITLGMGNRLFREGTIPAAFTVTDSLITPNGVIFANYERAGEVKTGTVGA